MRTSFSRSTSTFREVGRATPRGALGRAAGVAGRWRSMWVSAVGGRKVRMKKARSWNAMSSMGATGK